MQLLEEVGGRLEVRGGVDVEIGACSMMTLACLTRGGARSDKTLFLFELGHFFFFFNEEDYM